MGDVDGNGEMAGIPPNFADPAYLALVRDATLPEPVDMVLADPKKKADAIHKITSGRIKLPLIIAVPGTKEYELKERQLTRRIIKRLIEDGLDPEALGKPPAGDHLLVHKLCRQYMSDGACSCFHCGASPTYDENGVAVTFGHYFKPAPATAASAAPDDIVVRRQQAQLQSLRGASIDLGLRCIPGAPKARLAGFDTCKATLLSWFAPCPNAVCKREGRPHGGPCPRISRALLDVLNEGTEEQVPVTRRTLAPN